MNAYAYRKCIWEIVLYFFIFLFFMHLYAPSNSEVTCPCGTWDLSFAILNFFRREGYYKVYYKIIERYKILGNIRIFVRKWVVSIQVVYFTYGRKEHLILLFHGFHLYYWYCYKINTDTIDLSASWFQCKEHESAQ